MRIIRNILILMSVMALTFAGMFIIPIAVVAVNHDEQAGIGAIWAVGIAGCLWVIRLAARFARE